MDIAVPEEFEARAEPQAPAAEKKEAYAEDITPAPPPSAEESAAAIPRDTGIPPVPESDREQLAAAPFPLDSGMGGPPMASEQKNPGVPPENDLEQLAATPFSLDGGMGGPPMASEQKNTGEPPVPPDLQDTSKQEPARFASPQLQRDRDARGAKEASHAELAPPADLELLPAPKADESDERPRILCSAVLGLFPMANQGLLRDTQAMVAAESLSGPVESFIRQGVSLDVQVVDDPAKVTPP